MSEAAWPPKDESSEVDALLANDKKESTRACFGSCCWKEGCCTEDELAGKRDVFWDNWKGLAITGVLFIHLNVQAVLSPSKVFYESLIGRAYVGLGGFVMLATMPTFCFISGYFSTAQPQERQVIHQVRHSLAWFLMRFLQFSLTWYSHQQAVENTWRAQNPLLNETNARLGSEGKPTLAPPSYVPIPFFATVGVDWYLWCVIIWRCALPLLAMIHRPLLISFCIAFVSNFSEASYSEYSHAPCGFLPFFVGGFLFKQCSQTQLSDFRAWCDSSVVKLAFWAVPAIISAATVYSLQVRDHIVSGVACLYGGMVSRNFFANQLVEQLRQVDAAENMRQEAITPAVPTLPPASTFCQSPIGVLDVGMTYIGAFSVIFLAMSVVPREAVPILTKAGVNSIFIYFGHMWFAMLPAVVGAYTLLYFGFVFPPWLTVVAIPAMILFFVACLAQQWLRAFCKPFVEPDVETCCIRRKDLDGP